MYYQNKYLEAEQVYEQIYQKHNFDVVEKTLSIK